MSARGRHDGDRQAARKRALLARLLNERGVAAPSADAIGRRSDAEAFPISFAQQRLWFLDQLEPESPRYNVFTVLGLHGALDAGALELTLTEILRRHETLRARFVQAGGRPRQLIAPPGPFPLASHDLSGLPQAERQEELRRLALAEALGPFDLSRGPLVRGTLVRLDREENALLLGMHHIASDGWSMGVLTGELAALYAAFREGRPSPLPDPPLQYADFAAWQREWLSGEVLGAELAYWRRRLGGLETLELPTDRPRPAVQSFAGAIQSVALRAGLLEGLRKLGQRHEATLFMTFLAALQALLHRYSGQVDVAVGAPIAGRGRAEIESLIGFFANTLVLRTDLTGDPSFRVLLRRIQDVALGAYAHSELPFEKLVEELHPERDLSRNPLFQVALVLQNAPEAPLELPGLRVELGGVDNRVAKFDLTLYVSETGPGHLSFEYNTDLFEDATVARALGHLENLLAAGVAEPERRISALPLLSEREQRRLLLEWNATASEYPSGRTVLDLFAGRAAATPEALAVEGGGGSLSYGELDRRSNRLARRLRGLGVGPEVLVGVCLRRSPDLVVGLLGILKAGGAYLPLDPEYPKQRLHLMLEDASVPVLVSEQALLGVLPAHGAQVVCLDRDAEALASVSDAPLESGVSPENLAYVIYTSGSTGRPKGVQVQHGGLVNLASWHVRQYRVGPEDRATLIASIAFDASAWEVWPYLIAGASLHVPDEETRLLPRRLCAWLTERAVTHSFIMTPLAESLLAERGLDRLGLRYLLTGGDKLHRQAVQELPCPVVNHYGPTEYTVVTTAGEVQAGASSDPPIGRPISNTRVYVLDPGLRPVPQGVAGELYIGGAGLARGYLKRPDLTAARFVPDPFSPEPGGRLYRTGDLVRYRSDGSLDFVGRADHQVKLRGYRIEPGEIESRLESHPQIEQAAVLAREDEPGEKRLVAYAVRRAGSSVTVGELRDRLAEALPGYMVPSAFVFLESMPLSPNGKIDHRALPAPEATDRETDYEAPRTKAEATLSQIWSDVLRVERVGIRDNFFELGGDSILSIQIVARANEAGLRLTPKQVFQHQTVAGLAGVAGKAAAVEADQGWVRGEAPLTPIQRWFFERELEEAHHFNQAVLLEPGRELPAELLERAALELQRHHDALRLRFHRVGSGWVQEFAGEESASPFTRVALGEVEDCELAPAVTRAAERGQATLDLASGPVWRMVLIEPGRGRAARLLLAAHHLVVDGVSWRVLLEDLERACGQLLRGERVSLPRKTSSYRSWSERLRDHVSAGGFAEERGHWIRTVEAGTEALPRDFDGEEGSPADTAGTSGSVSVVLDEEATRTLLREVPAAYRTRIDEVLLTALCLAMREWSGRGSVLLDVESHGREELFEGLDLSRTVGWFTAIHPVRLELPDGGNPGEALKAVKERLRRVPHRGVGYGALLHLGGDRALRGAARPQLSFNYLGQFDQVLGGEGLFRPARESAGRVASPRTRRSHLLEVNGSIAGGRLRMDFSYGQSAHRRETVEALARGFETGLRRVIAHCRSEEAGGRTPSDFPLARLDQATLDLVMAGARDVDDVYPLSPMQQGLLFHTLLDPGVGVYVEQLRLDLQGEMNAAAWRRAWEHVVERHPVLRTRFAWKGLREPCQIVLPSVALPWEEEDWTGLGDDERQERLETLLEEDHRAGFDLETAPLLRHRLIRTGEDEHSFAWSFHHILFDGWCLPLLLNEVFRCYAAYREGRRPDLEPAPRFRDYVEWLEKLDRGQAEAYWRSVLRGFSVATPLPWDHRDVDDGEARYGEQTFELSREATARLRDLGRRHRLTLNTFVLGAWALLLSRYANEPDVVFGSTVSGRPADVPRVESMVGLFVNTLPLRTQAEGGERLLPWLGRIQAQQVEMREHDFVPLVDIRSWTDVPAGHSLFDTILGFQNYPLEPAYADLGPMRIRGGRIRERTHYALTLMVQPGAGLVFRALNDRRRVREADVTRMFGHLRTLLEGMAADPQRRLRELPFVTGGERDQVLVEWNATGRERQGESSVAEAFERAAERAPGAEAVVCGETRLTYGELDRRSNQLARHLVRLGVGPEVRWGSVWSGPRAGVGGLGRAEGGRRLPADGSGLSAGAARLHARRLQGHGASDAGASAGTAASARGAPALSRP
jgi:amino acid adenylation domain-containing protein/non-ribosomal peptide synthase protein (TIGR01720 family)